VRRDVRPVTTSDQILLFLAVTSATSAELIAVSSLYTYDIHLPYINPRATDRQIFWVTHAAIGVTVVLMGCVRAPGAWLRGLTHHAGSSA
jgi:Na+/proline symporter